VAPRKILRIKFLENPRPYLPLYKMETTQMVYLEWSVYASHPVGCLVSYGKGPLRWGGKAWLTRHSEEPPCRVFIYRYGMRVTRWGD